MESIIVLLNVLCVVYLCVCLVRYDHDSTDPRMLGIFEYEEPTAIEESQRAASQ